MNVKALTSAFLVAVIARSFAETISSPGPSDSRIRVAPYSQDAVYRLLGFVGFETDVEFEPMIEARFAVIKQGFERIRGREPRR